MSTLWWTIILSGTGTFLLRWWPLKQALKSKQFAEGSHTSGRWKSLLHKLLAGVGAAAVTALLVVSLWGLVIQAHAFQWRPAVATVAGLLVVVVSRRMLKGLAIPTLAGAIAYGLVMQWFAVGTLPL